MGPGPHNGDEEIAPDDALQFVAALSGRRFVLFLIIAALEAAGEPATGPTLRKRYHTIADEEFTDGGFYPALEAMVDVGVVEERPSSGRAAHWHVSDQGWRQLEAGYNWVGWIVQSQAHD